MTYLLSQYWTFTALALILGLFVGWATCGAADARGGNWIAWAGVAWIAGLFLALFKVVPGLAGHLLEVLLLLFVAYIVGCFTGCGGRWALAGGPDVSRDAPNDGAKPAPAIASPPVAFTHEDVLGVDSSASYPGERPAALAAPRGGAGDDLSAIAGIEGTTAKALRDIGVFHFDQIAGWGAPQKQWVEHHLAQSGRIDREGWIDQAKRLSTGAAAQETAAAAPESGGASASGGDRESASPPADAAEKATVASTGGGATGSDATRVDEADAATSSTAAAATPSRMMTDGARSLLAQQKKAAARAAVASAAPVQAQPEAVEEAAAPAALAPIARSFVAPARAPMTDGARTLAMLKRKEEERAARRATTAVTASEDATGAQEYIGVAADDARPPADDRPNAPADDLKLIKGVGPKNESILNGLGVRRFAQIADWSPANAQWVGDNMRFPGRIEREQWIAQAKLLAAGIDTPHSLAVKSGAIRIDESADAPLSDAEAAALVDSLPQQAAQVENEDSYSGARPLGLAAPRAGAADDLKLIKGIGRQNEERLHALGVWHFDQIAAWSPENVKWIGSYLAFPGRIDREHWIEQAVEFARAAKNAPTSRLI